MNHHNHLVVLYNVMNSSNSSQSFLSMRSQSDSDTPVFDFKILLQRGIKRATARKRKERRRNVEIRLNLPTENYDDHVHLGSAEPLRMEVSSKASSLE